MIRLHCTKKLLTALPCDEEGRLKSRLGVQPDSMDMPESPLSGWHAKLLLLQRRQCVLFVHDSTRFPVFSLGFKKADFAELNWFFKDCFMNTLLKLGAEDRHLETAAEMLTPLVCDNDCNRSVQGTMNLMGQEVGYMLRYDGASVMDLSPYKTGAWLAKRPCSIKGVRGYINPSQEMLALLESR